MTRATQDTDPSRPIPSETVERITLSGAEPAICARAETDLPSFADGELSVEAADDYRAHLITCEECRLELVNHVTLEARISALLQPTTLDVVTPRSGSCGS